MSANPRTDEMAALLRILAQVEQGVGERPISAPTPLAHLHEKAKSELAKPSSVDQNLNPMAERIATAMRLAVRAG
jgi:hypothetical protein